MTDEQRNYIDAIYQNCHEHLEDSQEYWMKAWGAFEKMAGVCGNDPEVNQYIISKMKLLEKEAKVFG